MTKDIVLMVDGVLFQATPWPKGMPNPGKNKYLVYANSEFIATAKTKKEFEASCRNGDYAACM